MRPITYEIKRTLTSKFVILMIVAIIGLSSALAYELSASSNSPGVNTTTPELSIGWYTSGGNLTFVGYAYNSIGSPYSGHPMTMYLKTSDGTSYSGSVNPGTGFVNITAPYNSSLSEEVYSYNYTYKLFGTSFSSSSSTLIVRNISSYSGYTFSYPIEESTNTSNLGFQLLYVGANGSKAPTTYINGYLYNTSSGKVSSNSTFSMTISNFNLATVYPSVPANDLNKTYAVSYNQSGVPFNPQNYKLMKVSVYTPITQSALQNLVFSGVGPILGLFIPILGAFAAYLTYGKDRTTGVLESVLKRPVTRHGLLSSRFAANTVSVIISVTASMFIADLFIEHYFGMYLDLSFTLFFIWTFIIEGLAFLAIIYMSAHLVKSQGALLGITIAAFLVLDLFWSVISSLILLALHVSNGTAQYIHASVLFNYISPSGYRSLVQFHYTNQIGLLGNLTANAASYGVTIPLLILAGILWVSVPFAITYWLSGSRD